MTVGQALCPALPVAECLPKTLRERQLLVVRSSLTSTQRLVAFVFTHYANRHFAGAWPSIGRVAEEAGLSERGARKTVRQLEQLRVLVSSGPRHGGCYRTTYYFMDFRCLRSLSRAGALAAEGGTAEMQGGTSFPRTNSMNNPDRSQMAGAPGETSAVPMRARSEVEAPEGLHALLDAGVDAPVAFRLAQACSAAEIRSVVRESAALGDGE